MKPTDSISLPHNYNFFVCFHRQYVTGLCKLMLRVYSAVPEKATDTNLARN
jgi:hypothetical protein